MTSAAPPETTRRPPASIAWFAFMIAMWALFTVLLARDELGSITDAVSSAPLVLELLWWLLGLPWLLAATVWEGSWDEPLRIALVLVIALGWSWLSWPRRTAAGPKT